ncbi:MAG: phosphoribosylglycinamide formyltransferase [Gammaproteobacteria bacterium]|tara:strand:+ start:2322 stop:2924 length:603 start_codon:yes stop_codon:yes gene_type:complete
MTNFKVAVLISGNGSNLQAIIDTFYLNKKIDICCVLSNKNEAYGLERAKKANIDNYLIDHHQFQSRQEFELAMINILDKYNPDLVVLAGFMRILSSVFVNKYLGKLINIHPSLLPKYKGLETHRQVIENNDEYHGVTVHFVDNTLDGGPICAQSSIRVQTKNTKELEREIHKLEHKIYPEVINEIAEGKIYFSDGEINKR